MRYAMLAAPGVGRIRGTLQLSSYGLAQLIEDRLANGQAYPGEVIVRVPRRLGQYIRRHHLRTLIRPNWFDLASLPNR